MLLLKNGVTQGISLLLRSPLRIDQCDSGVVDGLFSFFSHPQHVLMFNAENHLCEFFRMT